MEGCSYVANKKKQLAEKLRVFAALASITLHFFYISVFFLPFFIA